MLIFFKKTDFDNKIKNVTSNKNSLNELSKKVKAILLAGLSKDLINLIFLMEQNTFFHEYFEII